MQKCNQLNFLTVYCRSWDIYRTQHKLTVHLRKKTDTFVTENTFLKMFQATYILISETKNVVFKRNYFSFKKG